VGDGKIAVVLEPRRGRSDHGREEGACSKADQKRYVSWN
jgi:hypothetical protein